MLLFGKSKVGSIKVYKFTDLARSNMIQCKDCELCEMSEDGRRTFKCDPFTNIKEAECIAKWQLIRLDMLVASYQSKLQWQGKLAPLQDKIFKYMKREIDSIDESDQWKLENDEEDNEDKTE
jgi:hypothetical protein